MKMVLDMNNSFDVMDILTLDDDKRYIVCGMTNYKNVSYIFLSEVGNSKNIKFLEKILVEDEIHLREVNDTKLIQELLPFLAKSGIDAVKSVNFEEN